MIDDAALDEIGAVLRADAEKTEQGERPAAESLEALRGAGVFALRTPSEYGGAWAGVETVARQLTRLGRACPSSAWVAGTCMTAKTIAVRSGLAGAADLFADPDALWCGSGIPGGKGERGAGGGGADGGAGKDGAAGGVGGVRISGRWPNVSGCEDARWALLGVVVDGAFSVAVVPVADLAIARTWHMAGMRGTGSHTVVADDLLVPAERVAPFAPFTLADQMLYAMTVLGPVLGAAQGALDAIGTMFASDRKPFMSAYTRMGESAGARQWLAEATHLVHRAENTMFTIARAADSTELSEDEAPRLRMDLADAARDCRSAVERMLDLHGASGFNTANALQRCWRDVAVGSRHPHLNPYMAVERYGTALVG